MRVLAVEWTWAGSSARVR